MAKLAVTFIQTYLEAGIHFRFNSKLLGKIQKLLSRKYLATESLLAKYPNLKVVCFQIDASTKVTSGTVGSIHWDRGHRELWVRIQLPYFSSDPSRKRRHIRAMKRLIPAIVAFFASYQIDASECLETSKPLIEELQTNFKDCVYERD